MINEFFFFLINKRWPEKQEFSTLSIFLPNFFNENLNSFFKSILSENFVGLGFFVKKFKHKFH